MSAKKTTAKIPKKAAKRIATKKSTRPEAVGDLPTFSVLSGPCLGHKAYRGYAFLSDLARISKPDIFDQQKNPTGTQRNLSRQHARKAYQYVSETPNAFFPEIILNIRDASYVKLKLDEPQSDVSIATLKFVQDPAKTNAIVVSRLDGNHRLWFADGHDSSLEQLDMPVSFCFVMVPKLDDELALFRDINDNQMGMNTSHLRSITARLLGAAALKVTDPALYIVEKLHKDKTSPFYQKIHLGGKAKKASTLTGLTIANLRNAVQDMLARSAKITQFSDVDAQYELFKNYWLAVKKWIPDAWRKPSEFIIFRGVGLYAISYLGIEIIDRCLNKHKYGVDDFLRYLRALPDKEVFSAKKGMAFAGRAGGRKIAADLVADLEEEGEISISKLQKMILGEPPK